MSTEITEINTLENDFNLLIIDYQNTYKNFMDTINKDNQSFEFIENSTFVGKNILDTIENSSKNNCLMSCETTHNCSGATFDNDNNICLLNDGKGEVVSSQNKTAIVKKALYYSYKLKKLNDELINTTKRMMELTKNKFDEHRELDNDNLEKTKIIKVNYDVLEEDQIKIEQIIREYETLDSAYENGNIYVNSNYFKLIIFMIIAIVLVLVLFSFNFIGVQKGGSNVFYPFEQLKRKLLN